MAKFMAFLIALSVFGALDFCARAETAERLFLSNRISPAGRGPCVEFDLRKIYHSAGWDNNILPLDEVVVPMSWDKIIYGKLHNNLMMPSGSDLKNAKNQQTNLVSILKEIFRNEGVPHDLIWIAEVESSLNPEAESKAGAMGLFQLMPATAERFGLKLFPVDDRKAPHKSAHAAASYLRQLRNEFGCWALALAAYNAGEGRVGRAMKLNDARTFREVAPYLPSETRRYVPRVMAIMALREDQMRGVPSAAYFRP